MKLWYQIRYRLPSLPEYTEERSTSFWLQLANRGRPQLESKSPFDTTKFLSSGARASLLVLLNHSLGALG
jgi:hypothetical protein